MSPKKLREPPLGDSTSAPLGNSPPPRPLQSSTPARTWSKNVGSINMSNPQNHVNAPGGSGTVVNVIVHHGDGENLPTTNAQHDDIHRKELAGTTKADHKIYSNQLLTKERGYPLWVPGPGMQLPIEYRRQGISIGDVGIITSTGEFDFLFNILQPPEHAINRGSVPQGFSSIPRQALERDIHETIVYGPNTYLASSSVRKTGMKWISETSIDQRFESTAKDAAILVMPDGATTQNLLNTWGVRDTISTNAKEWYTYTRTTRGRYVKNGDIRVVVGVDKVSSWGIATSACNTGQTASYVFKHDPTHTYQWDCTGGSGRVGPQNREIRDLIEDNDVPENQCLFVRTINCTLSGKMWNEGVHPSSVQGLHCVEYDPVELGVHHPSAALHNSLHEKFPDAEMVITEDMDWISVLNDEDVVFPEPEDLCKRILKVHKLHNQRGIVQIVRKDDPWRLSSSTNLGNQKRSSAEKDEHLLKGDIVKGRTSQEKARPSREKIRIGRGLHSVDAPSTSPLKVRIKGVVRGWKKAPSLKSSQSTSAVTSSETNGMVPIPVVSSHSAQDNGGECSVCLEPPRLGFRPPVEKPYIVPECGHGSHTPPGFPHKPNLEIRGVCRRPTKAEGDGDGEKSNMAGLKDVSDSHSSPQIPGRDSHVGRNRAAVKPHDLRDDDPLEYNSSKSAQSERGQYIVAPSIQVRPEFSSLTRTNDPNQSLTCVVVIELPGPRVPGDVPGLVIHNNYGKPQSQHSSSGPSSPQLDNIPHHCKNHGLDESYRQRSDTQSSNGPQTHGYSPNTIIQSKEDSPQDAITEDLRNRIIDWQGHALSDLGPLQMYDLLSIRRERALREICVYLFKEAIICVVGEEKRGLSGVLRLKRRIYVRHIKNVTVSSAAGEMNLTIHVDDELGSFTLVFGDRASLESWKNTIQALVNLYHASNRMRHQESERLPDFETSAPLGDDDELSDYDDSPTDLHTSSGSSNYLSPLPHTQMDLILVISVPPPNSLPSTAQLKIRVIKAMLYFLVASLGPKDRLSLVTFEVGMGGNLRKTPFLMVGRSESRDRLEKFIDEMGVKLDESKDEFLVRGSKEEKTDVVTAVIHGLDVVLQRERRNPISGLILISDASDSIHRSQVDLVLARSDVANVPIHSFGYGRSHDPAALWLMSNHTSGTYTFVKDWYSLRDCVAGCVGGMMSIGLLNVKLHLRVVDNYRIKIRKVSGGPQSFLSGDGQDVDIDVGELRYGEKKEILVEVELDNTDYQRLAQQRAGQRRHMNATDKFVQSLGFNALTIDEGPDLVDGMLDGLINEVPVLEVDGSFFDPAAAKNVSRLAYPVSLTITLLPGLQNSQKPPSAVSDPVTVRRRMELLASDMITRALGLVLRRNIPQAQNLLSETERILHTVLQTIPRSLVAHTNGSGSRNGKELLTLGAVNAMQAILQDLGLLSEALEDNLELFAHDQKNFGAQQAMILRDQTSWSGRSAIERLFWTNENSLELVSRSADWDSDTRSNPSKLVTDSGHCNMRTERPSILPSRLVGEVAAGTGTEGLLGVEFAINQASTLHIGNIGDEDTRSGLAFIWRVLFLVGRGEGVWWEPIVHPFRFQLVSDSSRVSRVITSRTEMIDLAPLGLGICCI